MLEVIELLFWLVAVRALSISVETTIKSTLDRRSLNRIFGLHRIIIIVLLAVCFVDIYYLFITYLQVDLQDSEIDETGVLRCAVRIAEMRSPLTVSLFAGALSLDCLLRCAKASNPLLCSIAALVSAYLSACLCACFFQLAISSHWSPVSPSSGLCRSARIKLQLSSFGLLWAHLFLATPSLRLATASVRANDLQPR